MPQEAGYTGSEGFSLPLWLHANSNVVSSPYTGTKAGFAGEVNTPQEHINDGQARYMDIAYYHMISILDDEFDQEFNIN